MLELPFASYCNRFSGQPGWVVGRGPTRFQYEELGRVSGPVFFVNDAVSQERHVAPDVPSFFFAHDAAMRCWLADPALRSIPVVIVDQPLTGPRENRTRGLVAGADDPVLAGVARAVLYRQNGPLARSALLDCSREMLRESGQLYVGNGTIQPLLHFAWYVGCTKLHLVGCDGLPEAGYDERLENRSRSTQQNALGIRVQQEDVLRRLGLPREYLGTVPHRLEMIMELRATREAREKFLAGVEALLEQFRNFGCTRLAVRDLIDRSRGYWINADWPDTGACVACLVSPSYRAVMQGPMAEALGNDGENLRVGYRAVRLG